MGAGGRSGVKGPRSQSEARMCQCSVGSVPARALSVPWLLPLTIPALSLS